MKFEILVLKLLLAILFEIKAQTYVTLAKEVNDYIDERCGNYCDK